MTSITIHIGSYKTGSTAIQQYLKRNRSALLKNGWIYPHASCRNDNAHHLLPFALQQHTLQGDTEAENLVSLILQESNARGANNILLSSEVFFSLTPVEIQKLAALLSGYEVKIVCYLRRQDRFIHSFYMQRIKESSDRLAAAPEDYEGFNEIVDILRYDNIINLWEVEFGKNSTTIELFEKEKLKHGVIDNFSKLVGLDFLGAEHKSIRTNLTIKTELIEYLRSINSLDIPPEVHETILKELNHLSREYPDHYTNFSFISPTQQKYILSLYTESNDKLRRRYFPDLKYLFSIDDSEFQDNNDWHKPFLTTNTAARITSSLWIKRLKY